MKKVYDNKEQPADVKPGFVLIDNPELVKMVEEYNKDTKRKRLVLNILYWLVFYATTTILYLIFITIMKS